MPTGEERPFVVAVPGLAPDADELRRAVAERLMSYKLPKTYHFVNAFPRGQLGELGRKDLVTPAQAQD